MDQGNSPPMHYGTENASKRHATHTAPWERTAIMQVPFVKAKNGGKLSTAERHDVPTMCFARSNSVTRHDMCKKEQLVQPQRSHSISGSSPIEPPTHTWWSRQPAPYETQVFLPPSQDSSCRPRHMPGAPALPLTPPASSRGTSPDRSTSMHDKYHHDRDGSVQALPGTMSTRPPTSDRGPRSREHNKDHESVAEAAPDKFGARFKSSIQSIFKKKRAEEGDLIQVGAKHWTEE